MMASLPSAYLFPLMGGGQVIITKLPMEDPVMLSLPGNPRHWPRAPEDAPWVVFAVSPS